MMLSSALSLALAARSGDFPAGDLSFTSGLLPASLTFSRASAGTYTGSDGLIKTAANDTPRFDYDPLTHVCLGLKTEETRTNVNTVSASYGAWTGSNVTSPLPTDGYATAPDGAQAAWVIPSGASSFLQNNVTIAADITSWTVSFYAKAIASGAKIWTGFFGILSVATHAGTIYDFDTDTVLSANGWSRELLANGWVRLKWTGQNNGSGTTLVLRLDSDSATTSGTWGAKTLFWGTQVENAPFASSYIPTSGSAVTRLADRCYTTSVPWLNQTKGTMVSDFISYGVTDVSNACALNSESFPGLLSNGKASTWNGSSSLQVETVYVFGTLGKAAVAYDATGRSICALGGTVASDAGTYNLASPLLTVGSVNTSGG